MKVIWKLIKLWRFSNLHLTQSIVFTLGGIFMSELIYPNSHDHKGNVIGWYAFCERVALNRDPGTKAPAIFELVKICLSAAVAANLDPVPSDQLSRLVFEGIASGKIRPMPLAKEVPFRMMQRFVCVYLNEARARDVGAIRNSCDKMMEEDDFSQTVEAPLQSYDDRPPHQWAKEVWGSPVRERRFSRGPSMETGEQLRKIFLG